MTVYMITRELFEIEPLTEVTAIVYQVQFSNRFRKSQKLFLVLKMVENGKKRHIPFHLKVNKYTFRGFGWLFWV